MPIQQPSNQIKFTNVSVVRLKKGKKRFELACYKNKLLEYRSGAEKDLDNVLQVPTIFLSVSKAQTAPSAELTKAFGANTPADEIRQEILRKGEVQVGERERKDIIERVEKEVLDIVSGRLVDPTTKRVYTPGMISKALDQLSSASGQMQQSQGQNNNDGAGDEVRPAQPRKPLWTGVTPNKSAKIQALEAMKALIAWQPIPVMRARMRLRVTCPVPLLKQSVKSGVPAGGNKEKEASSGGSSKSNKKGGKGSKKSARQDSDAEGGSDAEPAQPKAPTNVKDKILSFIESVESQEIAGDEWEVVGFAEPGAFKGLNEFVGNDTRGRGRVEVLDMAVTHED
ncbi:SBDS protein C-terminal domain-containing protein [Aspergillus coremiiformis]|uniref:SBDS protein C-terminal domain-containing protein n=1 Tax=Aspergillus coremiiformis TaxID=138285 RepID=A0A5N6Z0K7_9EURO|nr:SBDS protein C-terminal domain-containing protein [Aspergillus coremiiformis]